MMRRVVQTLAALVLVIMAVDAAGPTLGAVLVLVLVLVLVRRAGGWLVRTTSSTSSTSRGAS